MSAGALQPVPTMSTGQAAEALSVTAQTIRRWCEQGDVPAWRVGMHWRVAKWWVAEQLDKVRPFVRGKR